MSRGWHSVWPVVLVPTDSIEKGKGGGGGVKRRGGESGAAGLVPNTKEGVWVIGCASPVMSLMCMLKYKDKLFDK